MSQHELCDKIADSIAEFQDTVSEVEQSITGKLAIGNLKPVSYKVTSLKKFVEDVLDATNTFYKSLEDEGDTYTGMRSDCESFLSDMQRNLYLVNFTMKEDLKRRLANRINESYRSEENEKKFNIGRHTENLTDGGMAKRISDIIKNSQFNKRPFKSLSDCIERCQRTFSKAGDLHVIGNMNNVVFLQLDAHNGYSYFGQIVISEADNETGTVVCTVSFNPSGIKNSNPDPEMSEPTIEDCNNYEICGEGRIYRMTGNELHSLIKESVKRILKEHNPDLKPTETNEIHPDYAEDLKNYDEREKIMMGTQRQKGRDALRRLPTSINNDEYGASRGANRVLAYGYETPEERAKQEFWQDYDNSRYHLYGEGRVTRMTGNELHNLIKESIKGILGYDRR
jgi:hypothetical protein